MASRIRLDTSHWTTRKQRQGHGGNWWRARVRRVDEGGRCFGHTLNLSAKALLFGHNVEAFEEQLSGEVALSEAEYTLWRRKGPVGKLHNLVVDVQRSDQLTYLLRSIQRSEFDLSSDLRIRARQPVDLIIDNDTRWLLNYT